MTRRLGGWRAAVGAAMAASTSTPTVAPIKRKRVGRAADTYRAARRNQCLRIDKSTWSSAYMSKRKSDRQAVYYAQRREKHGQ
jgi:hypothetical protein